MWPLRSDKIFITYLALVCCKLSTEAAGFSQPTPIPGSLSVPARGYKTSHGCTPILHRTSALAIVKQNERRERIGVRQAGSGSRRGLPRRAVVAGRAVKARFEQRLVRFCPASPGHTVDISVLIFVGR
jgi:hypothetical protein